MQIQFAHVQILDVVFNVEITFFRFPLFSKHVILTSLVLFDFGLKARANSKK